MHTVISGRARRIPETENLQTPAFKKQERNGRNEGEWSRKEGDLDSKAPEAKSTDIFKECVSTV